MNLPGPGRQLLRTGSCFLYGKDENISSIMKNGPAGNLFHTAVMYGKKKSVFCDSDLRELRLPLFCFVDIFDFGII